MKAGTRLPGVDERLERPDHFAHPHLARPDLGDRAVCGGAARRLEVQDAEGDLGERNPEVVERALQWHGRTIPNICSIRQAQVRTP